MATFTLTGTFKHQDGITPIVNSPINVVASPFVSAGSVLAKGKTLTTDANGQVTFTLTTGVTGLYYLVRSMAKTPLFTNKVFLAPTAGTVLDINTLVIYDPTATVPDSYTATVAARDAAVAAAAGVQTNNWAATTAYSTGQTVRAPDGSAIKRIASGTSRATYDATEQALWTILFATTGTQEQAVLARRTHFSVTDYGAKGDGTTDDTAAIQAAITALAAITPYDSTTSTNLPTLFFPAGRYRVRSTFSAITSTKVRVQGAGTNASQIWYDPTSDTTGAVLFDFGTFSATPANIFAGNQDITFEAIRIQHASPSVAGSRKGQAIRSSGGGGLTLRDVAILGFKYGVNCPYGGDFNHYDHTDVEYCDVGYYLGPGAQQILTNALTAAFCVEGVVLDRCGQIHMAMPVFNSNATSGVTLEAVTDTTTRQLTSFSTAAVSYSTKIVLDSPWFESNAGGLGDAYTATHYVYATNGGSDSYRNLDILNPYVVGTGPTKTPTSLVGNVSGGVQNVRVVRPVLRGALTNWFYNPTAAFHLDNPYTTTGSTAPAIANNNSGWFQKVQSLSAGGEEVWTTGALPMVQKFEQADHAHGISVEHAINGIMRLGFQTGSSWITPRLGFDVQNSRIYLGDPSTAASPCITSAASIPTTGSFGKGTFVFNTAATTTSGKVLLGWLRLTTGSAHVSGTDWTPFWGTTT